MGGAKRSLMFQPLPECIHREGQRLRDGFLRTSHEAVVDDGLGDISGFDGYGPERDVTDEDGYERGGIDDDEGDNNSDDIDMEDESSDSDDDGHRDHVDDS